MRRYLCLPLNRFYTTLFLCTTLVLTNMSAKGQCFESFDVYQLYPYGQLCSPQTVTLRAEYYDTNGWGEFRWYTSDTDPVPVHTGYIDPFGNTTSDYSVYATDGLTIWVSFYNYNTGCESYRQPYTFYISSPPILYQDYAKKCGYELAKVQVSSNTSGVTFQLYKLYSYYDPWYGNVQEYQYIEGNTTGYFEIWDFDPADEYNYYVKVYQQYGCSSPYYYQLYFELTGPEPPAVSGNLSIPAGTSTTLTASGNASSFNWYDATGNLFHTGSQYTTPSTLAANTYTYHVRGVSFDGTCLTDPAIVTVTVNLPVVTYSPLYNLSLIHI